MTAKEYLMYRRRDSWFESVDPRAKIVASILYFAALLTGSSLLCKTIMLALLTGAWAAGRLSLRLLIFTLLPLTLLFGSTMIYHLLLFHAGDGHGPGGIAGGFAMCLQIAGLVILLAWLVRVTAPLMLAEGMERLLAPLKRFKLPVHETVLMFTIALQFIPILIAEFDLIRQAQLARGGGIHRGGVLRRLRGVLPILMPMIVRSIIRAEELAIAMEARCYNGGEGRTSLRSYTWRRRDTVVLVCSAFILLYAVADRMISS